MNSQHGIVWFTSTQKHAENINHTHILKYTTREKLNVIFEQNLTATYNENIRGYEYATTLRDIMRGIREKYDIILDGYVGCNECELGLTNVAVRDKINPRPIIVKTLEMRYID